ncbi:MAG TPA: hydroxymethylglutaryl-CoA lyase [Acidimicrobiales bacterium]|nr:hydroxymethylglutaryl-CoA lyase [Acidimicrobiales bacterium]
MTRLTIPPPAPVDGLPTRVEVYEVGPRDGLQNEATPVPVAVKHELVERLVDAGVRSIEVTSMVPPSWVPQLADAEELLSRLSLPADVRQVVLTPNLAGLRRALDHGVPEVAVFASATETFSQRNLNRSIDESLAMFAPVVETARREGVAVRGYVSMVFGDPWEGDVPVEQVVSVARRLVDMGCTSLSLGDTIGVGSSGHVVRLIAALARSGIGPDGVGVHFHDTYGQALANAVAALRCGVTTVDVSAGGLGGCPYAESATGNLATEDLVWHLHGLGIATGIDLPRLAETSAWISAHLGRPTPSRAGLAIASKQEHHG